MLDPCKIKHQKTLYGPQKTVPWSENTIHGTVVGSSCSLLVFLVISKIHLFCCVLMRLKLVLGSV